MDSQYLDKLVHPVYKTPLRYDEKLQQLSDGIHNDVFVLKKGVPVLLTAVEEPELTITEHHSDATDRFHYKEHYQLDSETYDYFEQEQKQSTIEQEEHNRLHQYILSQMPAGASWILDVGCGGGWLAKALANKGKRIISMDISDINPVKATQKFAYSTHFGLVADVFELPIKAGTIDCIVASEIIEHVSDPKRFLESLFTALKPGGRLVITTPYNEHILQSLCIHCNHLTPHNAHLHSFNESSIKKYLPANIKSYSVRIFNSKLLVRLGIQRLFRFLPLGIYKAIDNLANALTKKRAYRLILVIEK